MPISKLQVLFSRKLHFVRSNIKSRENHNGFPALFFYPNGERRLAKWTDNITGKLSDERFAKLSRVYEDEQDELKEMIGVLKKDVQKQEKEQINIKSFIGIAKKYTDIQELDATILREFISKIYVSAYDRKSKTREIQIVYNFIGAFDFDRAKLNTKNKSNNTSNLGNEVNIKAESGAA